MPCGCFYKGISKHKLKVRLSEQKYAIRTGNSLYLSALHYKEANHGSCHIKDSIRGWERIKKLHKKSHTISRLKWRTWLLSFFCKYLNYPCLFLFSSFQNWKSWFVSIPRISSDIEVILWFSSFSAGVWVFKDQQIPLCWLGSFPIVPKYLLCK